MPIYGPGYQKIVAFQTHRSIKSDLNFLFLHKPFVLLSSLVQQASLQSVAMQHILEKLASKYATCPPDRPIVTLTWAQSLDGKLSSAATEQTLISGSSSLEMTHALRAVHDAILVGSNTINIDDPRLTSRISPSTDALINSLLPNFIRSSPSSRNPVPVVLDSRLRITHKSRCLQQLRPNTRKPIVFCSPEVQPDQQLRSVAEVVSVPCTSLSSSALDIPSILAHLRKRGVVSVMVEGGPSVLSSFFAAGLWDIAIVTIAPTIFGAGPALSPPQHDHKCFSDLRFSNTSWHKFGEDIVMLGYPK